MALNEAQRNVDHTSMIQQFTMMATSNNNMPAFRPQATTQRNIVPSATVLGQTQHWVPPGNGGRGGISHSRNNCNHRTPRQGVPVPFIGAGNQVIPYIPSGMQQGRIQNPQYSNVVKQFVIKMCVSHAVFTLRIGTRAPHTTTGSRDIRPDSRDRTSRNTNAQTISFVAKRCTKQCIQASDS